MEALKTRILNYLHKIWIKNPNAWTHKGKLEDLIKDAGYLGDCGTRRIRELCHDGLIEKKPYGISTQYRYLPDITEIKDIF